MLTKLKPTARIRLYNQLENASKVSFTDLVQFATKRHPAILRQITHLSFDDIYDLSHRIFDYTMLACEHLANLQVLEVSKRVSLKAEGGGV